MSEVGRQLFTRRCSGSEFVDKCVDSGSLQYDAGVWKVSTTRGWCALCYYPSMVPILTDPDLDALITALGDLTTEDLGVLYE